MNSFFRIFPMAVLFVAAVPAWSDDSCSSARICSTEYIGPGNGSDRIGRLALSLDGNVIVGGHFKDADYDTDWRIHKYDADCGLLWAKAWHNTWELYGITVDPKGNILAAGADQSAWLVMKFDSNGEWIWSSRHDSGLKDFSGAVAADDEFVYAPVEEGSTNLSIKKIDTTNGSVVDTYFPGVLGSLWDAAISPITGDLILVGAAKRTDTSWLVLVYDRDGNQKWSWEYGSEDGIDDSAFGVAVDSVGNYIVSGIDPYKGMVVKFDGSGKELWRLSHEIVAYADVAIDKEDNIVAVGYSRGSEQDLHIRWFAADGSYSCGETIDIHGATDNFRGGIVTPDGNLMAGGFTVNSSEDWYVGKFENPLASLPDPDVPAVGDRPSEMLIRHVRVFPNPFNSETAARGTVKFEVPYAASVRIYTTRGLKAWEGEIASPGIIQWDGRSGGGKRVSPGTYMWVVDYGDWRERGTLEVE